MCVCVFVIAAADRSSITDRTQALPMRLCMLTAAGHKEEQLLMGLQYREPTQCFPSSLNTSIEARLTLSFIVFQFLCFVTGIASHFLWHM